MGGAVACVQVDGHACTAGCLRMEGLVVAVMKRSAQGARWISLHDTQSQNVFVCTRHPVNGRTGPRLVYTDATTVWCFQ